MGSFDYKDIYVENGRKVLEVNILPEKYCNFDCVFCPDGRAAKMDTTKSFDDMEGSINELESILDNTEADLIYINSKGEALLNDKVVDVINIIKSKGLPVRLNSNGYLLGRDEFVKIANMCDETVGTIFVISEEGFRKIHRPVEGYTFEQHISNMASFKKQYKGKFILKVSILKGYNDTEEAIIKTKSIIDRISADVTIIRSMKYESVKKAFGISDKRLNEISEILLGI